MKTIRIISLVPWWLVYNLFNLHEKAYDTRSVRGWLSVNHKPVVYITGWLFWIGVAAGVCIAL